MSSGDSEIQQDSVSPRRINRWTFWRVLSWSFAALLLIVLIAAAYIWQNRYAFLENTFEDILAEQGLDAELSINAIQKNSAKLSGITIDADGERVFSAKTLEIEYDWREALKGRMKRIELTEAELVITVDEKGKIIDGWMPASNDESDLVLPPEGLHLNDSRVKLSSPYGLVNAKGDVTFNTFEDFTANFTVDPAVFSFGALDVKGGGKISARLQPGNNAVTAALDFTDMVHPLASLSYASVKADVTFDLIDEQSQITGPLTLTFAELLSDTVSAENGTLDWDGSFAVRPDSAAIRQADGHWAGALKRMSYADAAGRDALSKALTLNEAMKAAPVTTHFADSLSRTVGALLSEADVEGAGEFLRFDDKVEVKLKRPLTVKSSAASAVISSAGQRNFYDYNRASDAINLAANAVLIGARDVTLKDISLAAHSPNGVSITDVGEFSTLAISPHEWTASSNQGPVRLGPFSAKTRYINGAGARNMQVELDGVNYDGPLPGGYAQGLLTSGKLSLDLNGGGLATTFVPLEGSQITVNEFETSAGWTAQKARFDLVSGAPFYSRGAQADKAHLSARLENVSAGLIEKETGRRLDVALSALEAATDIKESRQDWTLGLFGAEIKTDDFGGAGTQLGAKEAVLRATLMPESPVQIELTSEAASVRTDQISTQTMKIALKGTPTKFHLDFGGESYASAGLVKFADETLPELPLRGQLDYLDGLIVGQAVTVLPKAEETDIDIKFRLKEGTGTAQIEIARLTFAERGFQPQNLIPALQGKIASVAGSVSAYIDLAFSPDKPLESSGRATLNNLDFGTLPGPFRGVNTEIEFSSIFPLVSSGVQRMSVDSFNPGVNLVDGVIEYELVDQGVKIHSAIWPLANGFISVDPAVWKYDAPENRVVLRIDDVSVGAFLGQAGKGGLTVTGDVVGVIPVVVAGVDVRVEQGQLSVENGGIIQYRSQELTSVVDLIPEKYVTLQDYQQFKDFRKNEDLGENVGKDLAFTALRNFEYKSLSAKIDGPLDGEIEVNVRFIGSNPKILDGTEFDFNVTVIGELVNLVRGLKPDASFDRIKGYQSLQISQGEGLESP